MQFSVFNLCSLTLACSGSLWTSLLYCLQVLMYIEQMSPEFYLLWAGQSQLSVSLCNSLHLLQYFHVTPVLWGGKASLPLTCREQSPSCSPGCCQPSLLQWCIAGSQSLIMINMMSTQSSRSFSAKLLSSSNCPKIALVYEVITSQDVP